MSSNLPLIRRSRRVLPWLRGGGLKLEINIPSQQIHAKQKGGGGEVKQRGRNIE